MDFSRISASAEPSARYYHAVLGVEHNMFLWAGCGGDGSAVPSSIVEKFNVLSTAWQEPRQLHGQCLPRRFDSMAISSDGQKAYCFGGYVGADGSKILHKALYVLDLLSMRCREITLGPDSPTGRANSAMVHYRRKLVVYGGWTGRTSDELFVVDLDTSEANSYI